MTEAFPDRASSPDVRCDTLSSRVLHDINTLLYRLDPDNYDLRCWRGTAISEMMHTDFVESFVREELPLCSLWLQKYFHPATASEFRAKIERIVDLWGKWYWPIEQEYGDILKDSGDYSEWLLDHPAEDGELDDFLRELQSLQDWLYALDLSIRATLPTDIESRAPYSPYARAVADPSSRTVTEPTPDGNDGEKVEAVPDDDELQVLYILEDRATLTKNEAIEKALREAKHPRSQSTVKVIIRRLIDKGWVVRPRPRAGVRLTEAGKAKVQS